MFPVLDQSTGQRVFNCAYRRPASERLSGMADPLDATRHLYSGLRRMTLMGWSKRLKRLTLYVSVGKHVSLTHFSKSAA